ncbi:hypothetical protein HDE69_001673 [Pedobacter cryoconitis]|uniref:Uncharacterized protein n=1 Tax=Pedobacter cryoconitis TaxID=188932 RepID=A0A7W8YRT3_9SPHI|nr:hypothetical protein [Pedobacter cryoconitis]MBB5620624.1 hypothetical protein [Pedobacter cryoconitis]MBB5646306.1 hypothetical protein [Pedobacter cryoconitis]
MRYLAININYKLDQDWYCRLGSIVACHKYFSELGPEHGPGVAIYDTEMRKYMWLSETYRDDNPRLIEIIQDATKYLKD